MLVVSCRTLLLPARATLLALLTLLATLLLVPASCTSGRASGSRGRDQEFRGVWVTRWDYRSAADVERVIDDAADTGFTDVFLQVRGQGDAFYRSSIEPWGEDLFRGGTERLGDPGFDPLRVAVLRAHQRGVRLHAWVNVYPLWKGTTLPKDPRHPFNRRPEWRLLDQDDKPQPLGNFYVIVNPTDPDVQNHIAAVMRDLVRRYDIDGLHFDYVRFVNDQMPEGKLYPADRETMTRFYKATGHDSLETDEARSAHSAWIRDNITQLVRRMAREARGVRPGIEVSAAVVRRPEIARDTFLQDGAAWAREGTVDRLVPMIYTESNEDFRSDLDAWLAAAPGKPVTVGIGAYKNSAMRTLEQVRLGAPADGYCLFAYASLFESVNPFEPKDEAAAATRTTRRNAITPIQTGSRRTTSADDSP